MSNLLNSVIFVGGIQYFLDASQAVRRVFYFNGNEWQLSSEVAEQAAPPNTAIYLWWSDTSTLPAKLKYYDGTIWKVINMV